jgi:hypothetical protein
VGWSKHHQFGTIHHTPGATHRGYTILTVSGGDQAILVDMDGRVCHRWQYDAGISYARLLPNGNLLLRAKTTGEVEMVRGLGGATPGLVELDWDSNVVWEYWDAMLHHDYARLPNGNTLLLLWEAMPPKDSAAVKGGYTSEDDPDQMLGDIVREVSPDGQTLNEWSMWKNLALDEDIICPLEGRREWTHGNSLSVANGNNLLVSFRRTDTVGIVSRETGEFTWKWGSGQVSHQHHATQLENGHVLLFDNGEHSRRTGAISRVVEVDPETNEIAWEYKGDPPMSFYSSYISGADRLPNGNTLITEGAHGRVIEVTPPGEIVWEHFNPFFFPGRDNATSNAVFRAHRYGPDHTALAGRDLDPDRHANLNRLYAGGA